MRLLQFTILLFFCSHSLLMWGQKEKSEQRLPITVKWTPTALLGYSSAQFAGEFFYHKKHSIQLEYGYVLPFSSTYNIKNSRGHKIRLEHRTFFNPRNPWYFAPEVSFSTLKFDVPSSFATEWEWVTDSISSYKKPIDSFDDKIGIEKKVVTFNVKIGYQFVLKRPSIVFDIYAGAGARYTYTRHTSYPAEGEMIPYKDWSMFDIDIKEGKHWMPNLILGVKVGYQF